MHNLVAIDVETSGLDPSKHQILEFGAVHYASGREFRRIILPLGGEIVGDAYALGMNAALLCEIKAEMDNFRATGRKSVDKLIHIEFLRGQFVSWLKEFELDISSITVLGKNFGAFDYQFLKKHGVWPHRHLELGSLFFKIEGDKIRVPGLKEISGAEAPHTAIGDCKLCCELFSRVLQERTFTEHENSFLK